MFIVWFRVVGVKYRFKYYHLNITQGVLDKNRSQNCKERDTQAVRQGMKKEEEEEEEKRKLERNLVVSQCCCLVQSSSNVKQKKRESFSYTHTTTQKRTNDCFRAKTRKRAPPRNLNDSLPVLIIVALSLPSILKWCQIMPETSPNQSL